MDKVSYKELNADLARHLDAVADTGAPLVVKRKKKKAVVVMPLDEFESWQETAYLLASPGNARELRESIAQVSGGRLITKAGDLG
jgi:antitoxin YefM